MTNVINVLQIKVKNDCRDGVHLAAIACRHAEAMRRRVEGASRHPDAIAATHHTRRCQESRGSHLSVEEGADGPGPLDLGLRKRVRDVVGPVYYDQFLGRTPERIIESPLRFTRSVGVLVAVDN